MKLFVVFIGDGGGIVVVDCGMIDMVIFEIELCWGFGEWEGFIL